MAKAPKPARDGHAIERGPGGRAASLRIFGKGWSRPQLWGWGDMAGVEAGTG
jgi:hypothetical protein